MGVLAGQTNAILIKNSRINHLPTLATEVYTKSLHNTIFGCYKCHILSYVGCKNYPCSSITQQFSFVSLIHVNPDTTKLKYVSTKSKTCKLCAKRIGEFDGFCLCISYLNCQCFYLCGVSFIFIRGCINVTIDFDRETNLNFWWTIGIQYGKIY